MVSKKTLYYAGLIGVGLILFTRIMDKPEDV